MLAISNVLGELTAEYFLSAKEGNLECRLIVPGLTKTIANEIHEYLFAKDIRSFLVIDEFQIPDESKGWLRPNGLTSERIGSFVAVVSPGQLANIQDSVRGSGGTTRALAFSEEWPWIDNGCDSFKFHGPVLNRLVSRWTQSKAEKDWLMGFVRLALISTTTTYSSRAQLLLEEILGSFDPLKYRELGDIRHKLLFHAGIPFPAQSLPQVNELKKTMTILCTRIVDRCKREADIREQVHSRAQEIIENDAERERTIEALDALLDGIGSSPTTSLGHLALQSCWGTGQVRLENWRLLTADKLRSIFEIRELPPASVTYEIECSRGKISNDGKTVITFFGEVLTIKVAYSNISASEISLYPWRISLSNRNKEILKESVSLTAGTAVLYLDAADNLGNYSRRIPLKLALLAGDDARYEARLSLHLCGEDRPGIVFTEPGFETVDAVLHENDESPDKKIDIVEPVHICLAAHNEESVSIENAEGEQLEIAKTEHPGMWKTTQRIDPSSAPGSQVKCFCKFGDVTAIVALEAADVEKGEFTLEDELRRQLVRKNEDRVRLLMRLFKGESKEPYPYLGKINPQSRRRAVFSSLMTGRIGWRPILANLRSIGGTTSRTIGDYIYSFDNVEGSAFSNLAFSEDVLGLIRNYSNTRDTLQKKIVESVAVGGLRLEHPIYASHPILVTTESDRIQELIIAYLASYIDILSYLEKGQSKLEWSQLFVLTHLDCVVHWENGQLKNSIFLLGPWHPLVLSKRFMVQSALVERAQLFLSKEGKKFLAKIVSLLEGVQGFRWFPAVSADDRQLVPAYVSSTSDPGWHVAFKTNLFLDEDKGKASDLRHMIRTSLGLDTNFAFAGNDDMAASCLSSYRQAYPSRRAIGVRVCHGYSPESVVQAVDRFLHQEDAPTLDGCQLPGGVSLFLQQELAQDAEFQRSDPPIRIFRYQDDEDCFREGNPDIYMISPDQSLSFRVGQEEFVLPRGQGPGSVFYEPISWLTEGQSQLPKSVTYDRDQGENKVVPHTLGECFVFSLQKISRLFNSSISLVQTVSLPINLNSPWAASPGGDLDPAIFVKYVRDGVSRSLEERALWDYRIDISSRASSYYVLSRIPKGFSVAVNGLFGLQDVATSFIVELGELGIAIGGEALRSGRHAMGVVGLVGSVRMLRDGGPDMPGLLRNDEKHVSFLVPVDAFSTLFGHDGSKRTDLLVIQIIFPESPQDKLRILACGIESKFVSATYSHGSAIEALRQAKTTIEQLRSLLEVSLLPGGIPERLGLLAIIRFGLRITSPSSLTAMQSWIEKERKILDSVLAGKYEYIVPAHESVLVSTEIGFPGPAVTAEISEGLWIRLNKANWPGISESPSIQQARTRLAALFGEMRPRAVPKSPATGSSPKPQESPSAGEKASEPKVGAVPIEPSQKPTESATAGEKAAEATIGAAPSEQSQEPIKSPVAEEEKSEPHVQPSAKNEEPKRASEPPAKEPQASGRLEPIFLGVDNDRRPLYYDPQMPIDPLDNLNVMVTGSPGTGKTQLLKYLICELREQAKNVFILDFKNDFAIDANFTERARLTRVFATIDGLPFNPLIPFPIVNPRTGDLIVQLPMHIAGVASVLTEQCDLGPQQHVSLKNAITSSFKSLGFSVEGFTGVSDGMRFPDLSDVGEILSEENVGAFNRLYPLFTLGLFKEEYRNKPFHSLINSSLVLDFSLIPSNQIKNALSQLVVLSAHNYYNTQPQSGVIRQVLVLDEAHRVLKLDFMPNFIRECRAYGVSTVLSSQYPSDFAPDISSAMATKILHSNGRDVNRVRAIVQMLGCEGQEEEVASLDRFQVLMDNRHYPHIMMRTMNYPLFLVWSYLLKAKKATRGELSGIHGLDTSKLPLDNLVRQLENFGYVEERGGYVNLYEKDVQA